jgi:hypothetical protein
MYCRHPRPCGRTARFQCRRALLCRPISLPGMQEHAALSHHGEKMHGQRQRRNDGADRVPGGFSKQRSSIEVAKPICTYHCSWFPHNRERQLKRSSPAPIGPVESASRPVGYRCRSDSGLLPSAKGSEKGLDFLRAKSNSLCIRQRFEQCAFGWTGWVSAA